MRTLAVVFLFPFLCTAADTAPSLDSVVELARAVPGEFAADALIRLAALNSLDKARKIQLLELAFQRASESQEPLKRQPAIVKVPGAANFLKRAFSQDLDALSLRVHVIEAMEPLDAVRAASLLQQIPPLNVPKLKCADFMAYSVAPYYRILSAMGTPALVLKQLGAITSPVEIGPAARVVLGTAADGDLQGRLTAFSAALGKISGDDRSFTLVGDLGPQMLSLVEESKRRKISPLPLLEAYRLYLVNNEQTARCADDDLMEPGVQTTFVLATGSGVVGGEGVGFFNAKLRIAPIQEIQEQETTPTRLEGVAEGLRGCQATSCLAISRQYNELIFNPESRTAYPPARKNTPEWQGQVKSFLAALAEWKPDSATTAAQYYRQKSAIYADTLSLVPAGPLQEEVVKAILDFTRNSQFKTESRIEWFLPINILVGRMSIDPLGPGRYAEQLRQSKDPVIALYSALEAIAPRTPDKIMALM